MSSTVSYPSAVVTGPPRISLEMPEGWVQVWAPDTLIAIRDDAQGDGHFLANVIVRYYQRLAPFGTDEIHAELKREANERTQGEVGAMKGQPIGDREWVGADLAYIDDQAGTIGQVHWFTAQQKNDVIDVVQVTGSYGGSRREPDYGTIDAIVDSVRINP